MEVEHPIIYSTAMVRAYLEDRKIMTRRVIKLDGLTQPDLYETRDGDLINPLELCPYGQAGSKLWVRETHAFIYDFGRPPEDTVKQVVYKADGNFYKPWRPSIHMPRWASRLTQTITEIRVERLQNITVEDAIAEGHPFGLIPDDLNDVQKAIARVSRKGWFQSLWDSINAKRGYSWESNPWVWVISFPKHSDEISAPIKG